MRHSSFSGKTNVVAEMIPEVGLLVLTSYLVHFLPSLFLSPFLSLSANQSVLGRTLTSADDAQLTS